MTEYNQYFKYLQQRSSLGIIYRNYWLYPCLSRWLKGNVLDVGCGIGDLLKYLPCAIGVDINPETVKWCKSLGLDARLIENNNIPFDDNTFDSIILDNVLEHLEEPDALIKEIIRVLKSESIFVVGVPGSLGYKSDPDHKKFYTKEALLLLMEKHGFRNEKVFAMPLNLSWLDTKISQYCVYGVFKI